MCDKSNAMTYAGGLWQRVFKEVSREYPQITAQHMYVDALCTQMVRDPAAVRCDRDQQHVWRHHHRPRRRSAGRTWAWPPAGIFIPGKTSMFEPVHGSAPPIAGKNIANPFGAILTAAMMLAHLGLTREAERIEAAVLEAVKQKKTTQDIGGSLGTREAGNGWRESGRLIRAENAATAAKAAVFSAGYRTAGSRALPRCRER